MATITDKTLANFLNVDTYGSAFARLLDKYGASLDHMNGDNVTPQQSGVMIAGRSDNTARLLRLDRMGSIRTGADQMLFHDDVEGANINTQLWTVTNSGMFAIQNSATGIVFNSAVAVTTSSYYFLQSQKFFSKTQLGPLHARWRLCPQWSANSQIEMGFANSATNIVPVPTGAFWRITMAGQVLPVLSYNSTEATGTDVSAVLTAAGGFNTANVNYYTWGVCVDDDGVLFTIQDSSTGQMIAEQTMQIPKTQAKMFSNTHMPFTARLVNSTSTPPMQASKMLLSDTYVRGMDVWTNKPWADTMATVTGGSELHPTAFTSTSNNAVSTAPASGTLSNTAASFSTLGGQFQFAAVAGAETDYVLFALQVPVNYSFYCTGIRIDTINTGAAVAGTPTVLQWTLANNATSATLATAGLRTNLGMQSFLVGAAIGQQAPSIDSRFRTPFRTDSGKYIIIALKIPFGTATASQVIRGVVQVEGYFE